MTSAMLKTMLLHPLRLAIVAAPAVSLYIFANGEAAGKPMDWWIDKAGFLAWVLGSYVLLFFMSFILTMNWPRIILFIIATACLAWFYLTPDVYQKFLLLPYFEGPEQRKMLPIIPYAFTGLIALIAMLFRPRRRPSASAVPKDAKRVKLRD